MPHPWAEVFWQIPTTGTYKITDARQMPGGEGMGTFGIDWAIKCYQLPIRLPVYSFRLSFRNCTSCVFLFFFTLGVGQGGKSYSRVLGRVHTNPDIFETACLFLRHSTFRPHETSEPAYRNPKPKPETRNPKPASFQNRSSECPKTPSTRIRVKNVRFQLGFNPVSNKPIPDRRCCILRNDHRIDFATNFYLL